MKSCEILNKGFEYSFVKFVVNKHLLKFGQMIVSKNYTFGKYIFSKTVSIIFLYTQMVN